MNDNNDNKNQKQQQSLLLEELITNLIAVYPRGCQLKDQDGKLPLHILISMNSVSIDLMIQIIATYPQGLEEYDNYGQRPEDYLRLIDDKDNEERQRQQQELLYQLIIKGKQAYHYALREVGLHFLLGTIKEPIHPSPAGVSSSSSKSAILRLAFINNKSINESNHDVVGQEEKINELESVALDLVSKNDTYAELLLNLTKERLNAKDDGSGNRLPIDHRDALYCLQDECSDLQKHVHYLEMVLRDHGLDKDGQSFVEDDGEMMAVVGMDPERPTSLTKYLEIKISEIQDENDTLETNNERLLARVEELQSMVDNFQRKNQIEGGEEDTYEGSPSIQVKSSFSEQQDRLLNGVVIGNKTPASTPDDSDKEWDSKLESLTAELDEQKSIIKDLQKERDSMADENERLRNQLEENRRNKSADILSTIDSLEERDHEHDKSEVENDNHSTDPDGIICHGSETNIDSNSVESGEKDTTRQASSYDDSKGKEQSRYTDLEEETKKLRHENERLALKVQVLQSRLETRHMDENEQAEILSNKYRELHAQLASVANEASKKGANFESKNLGHSEAIG